MFSIQNGKVYQDLDELKYKYRKLGERVHHLTSQLDYILHRTNKQKLDDIPLSDIEKYLREKKLKKLKNK